MRVDRDTLVKPKVILLDGTPLDIGLVIWADDSSGEALLLVPEDPNYNPRQSKRLKLNEQGEVVTRLVSGSIEFTFLS